MGGRFRVISEPGRFRLNPCDARLNLSLSTCLWSRHFAHSSSLYFRYCCQCRANRQHAELSNALTSFITG